jgi:hypothetical protein
LLRARGLCENVATRGEQTHRQEEDEQKENPDFRRKKFMNFVLILTYFRFIFVISIFIEYFSIIFDDANDPGSRSED